jgi:hypothetical protein
MISESIIVYNIIHNMISAVFSAPSSPAMRAVLCADGGVAQDSTLATDSLGNL